MELKRIREIVRTQKEPRFPEDVLWLLFNKNYKELQFKYWENGKWQTINGINEVWESLTNNTDRPNLKIHTGHIPNLDIDTITGLQSELDRLEKLIKSIDISDVLHFVGMSSTPITDGGSETPTINGLPYSPELGDIVLYNGLEFLWNGYSWVQFGDEQSFVLRDELKDWTGSTSITTVGTIKTGVWNGSKIANDYILNPYITINGKKVNLGNSISLSDLGLADCLVSEIRKPSELGGDFDTDGRDVFNAYTVNYIYKTLSDKIKELSGGSGSGITKVTVKQTGTGNAVTSVSEGTDGGIIVDKGIKFATSTELESYATKTYVEGKIAEATFSPGVIDGLVKKSGDTMTGDLDLGSHNLKFGNSQIEGKDGNVNVSTKFFGYNGSEVATKNDIKSNLESFLVVQKITLSDYNRALEDGSLDENKLYAIIDL